MWVPIIFETKDYGEHWDIAWTFPRQEDNMFSLYSVHGYDTTAWAVGDQGLMVKYTPQQQWQMVTTLTDLPLNDVFFVDEQHGWISGGYLDGQNSQSILLKTSDGGRIWSEIRFDKYHINDMYFADSLHGWAVVEDTSYAGMILESFDGGINWTPVIEGLSNTLNAIHFKGGVGWAVGSNGLVLRTDNWVDWINSNTGEKFPTNYQLFQNYPNPFNPVTNIEYRIPKLEHVELSIYNILGQKVNTLVNKKQLAGKYKVEWNASDLASGLYYCRLKTGRVQLSRKLLLLK
jgi:hypothetical protein